MKKSFTQIRILQGFIANIFIVCSLLANAQCPVGSIVNTPGTYKANDVACISAPVSGTISLKNKASLYIVNGGNFTGIIDANKGSDITVQMGGIFKPTQANNFASSLLNQGTTELGNGGLTLDNGASISNESTLDWVANWNMNSNITISNSACGTMDFKNTSYTLNNSSQINNNGLMIIEQGFTANSGTSINNRGKIYVSGSLDPSGYILNQNLMVINGSVTLNGGDSLVNLDRIFFKNGLTGSKDIRNEGLFWTAGSFQYNTGSFKQNTSSAELRIDGALANNTTIQGTGYLYFAGAISNNGTIAGLSSSSKLTVNQNITTGTRSNFIVNSSLPVYDTTTYTGALANRDACLMLILPVAVSEMSITRQPDDVELNWTTATELNSSGFQIERSADAINYSMIGSVKAKGNSSIINNYSFIDNHPLSVTAYYRIKMIDMDEKSEYSKILVVKSSASISIGGRISPNPFVSQFEISMTLATADQVRIRIMDNAGRMVKTELNLGNKGDNHFVINSLSSLSKGIYFVELTTSTDRIVQKLMKQ